MNTEIDYKNNPLHGVSLKTLVTEIVNHYGYDLLFAYLNIQCFKNNPSIDASVKFLKKTDWAREKVESFYLYKFKSLPRASDEQFELPPRDRIVPPDQTPGEPAELSMEDAERLRENGPEKRPSTTREKPVVRQPPPGGQQENQTPRHPAMPIPGPSGENKPGRLIQFHTESAKGPISRVNRKIGPKPKHQLAISRSCRAGTCRSW
jgi:uncharacterized protein (DUF2132 family)